MTELIFMLTHHDVTIPNAIEVFENEVKGSDLKFVGCKDIGLSLEDLEELFLRMKEEGLTTFLEVVSYDEGKHFEGIDKAICVGADYIIGGMPWFAKKTVKYLREKEAKIKFFPYIGRIVDHPCRLEGTVEEIVDNGLEFEKNDIEGINLLLYRYSVNVDHLFDEVTKKLHIPIIYAGSVDNYSKIRQLTSRNVFAFTIGSAILEYKFSPENSIRRQIEAVLEKL
jgi:hypothetical protein